MSRPALFSTLALIALTGAAATDVPEWETSVQGGPGPRKPDISYPGFDPEVDEMPEPRKGGRVIVHLAGLPKNMNYMIENSSDTRRMLREVHERLVQRNWETWEYESAIAEWVAEDTLVLKGGRGEGNTNIHFGRVTREDDQYRVEPLSAGNPLEETMLVPAASVEEVLEQTVYTFQLKPGIKFHDGHVLDADDVRFSYECYLNPHVDCEAQRFKFQKIAGCDVLGPQSIRFFFGQQYYLGLDAFMDLTILPSHLYNLRDADNPEGNPDATDEQQGAFVNEHPANRIWVGIGPYQVVEWGTQFIEAKRFEDYFDPQLGGYVDTIRWRHVPGDDAAKQAVLSGELDYWERLRPEDYYGEFTRKEAFTERYYKGLASYNYMGYLCWNTRRFKLEDPRVRTALGHAFDMNAQNQNVDYGLASTMVSTVYYFARHYARDIEPLAYDPSVAEELLAEAGWYDTDGDGVVDKDGVPLELEYLMQTGNKSSEIFGQSLQESLGRIGVKVDIASREWASFLERLMERDFDCANLGWITPVESDPEQIWHSRWADVDRSSNHAGFQDEETDRLIEAIQVEMDREKRHEMFLELQQRIYDLQPYLFMSTKAKKFVMSKRVRNFRQYAIDPGYRIREWYIVGEG